MESYYDQLKLYYLSLKSRLSVNRCREQGLLRLELCKFLLEHVQDPQQEIEQLLTQAAECKDLSENVELFKAQIYFSSGKVGLAKQILKSSYNDSVA
jgi:hypothetical protein